MPRRDADRNFTKMVATCPYCRRRAKMDLVEGPPRQNNNHIVVGLVLAPFTCGLSLLMLLFPQKETALEAYCDDCEESFPI